MAGIFGGRFSNHRKRRGPCPATTPLYASGSIVSQSSDAPIARTLSADLTSNVSVRTSAAAARSALGSSSPARVVIRNSSVVNWTAACATGSLMTSPTANCARACPIDRGS